MKFLITKRKYNNNKLILGAIIPDLRDLVGGRFLASFRDRADVVIPISNYVERAKFESKPKKFARVYVFKKKVNSNSELDKKIEDCNQ